MREQARVLMVLVVGALFAAVSLAAACAQTGAGAASQPSAPRTLRSERRLQFLLAASPNAAAPDPLRVAVAHEMVALGLPVTDDAGQAFDVEIRVAPVAGGGAEMQAFADGHLLDRWSVASGSATDVTVTQAQRLVETLAHSEKVSGYADSLYGVRLRPLRDSVGRHAHLAGDRGGTPPLEATSGSDE